MIRCPDGIKHFFPNKSGTSCQLALDSCFPLAVGLQGNSVRPAKIPGSPHVNKERSVQQYRFMIFTIMFPLCWLRLCAPAR